LDAKLRLEMRTEIRRLHQSLGLTTVYVTHDQEEALSLADRLVVLRDGRVQQIGTPEELHTRPANWHVADFMGFRNLLRLRAVESRQGADTVVVEGHGLKLRGTPVGEVAAGDEVIAAVRPEQLNLESTGGPDGLPATVEVVEYQGREVAVEVRAGDGVLLHARSHSATRPAPGDEVTVTVDPAALLVFPTEPAGPASPAQSPLRLAPAHDGPG
jgi:putative spermidine/putrescine transport system ATP-binding protein